MALKRALVFNASPGSLCPLDRHPPASSVLASPTLPSVRLPARTGCITSYWSRKTALHKVGVLSLGEARAPPCKYPPIPPQLGCLAPAHVRCSAVNLGSKTAVDITIVKLL